MEVNLLLVCEGPTDYPLVKAIGDKLSTKKASYNFHMLEPQIDATSGNAVSFGWGQVCNWCSSNRNKVQMFLAFKGAKALFIHMDTDIATQIDPAYTSKGLTARDCCENKLNNCMGSSSVPKDCYYILPTECTETWLLATHDHVSDPKDFPKKVTNYEGISGVLAILHALGYKGRKGKIKKEPKRYVTYGLRISENLATCRARCAELDNLCKVIVSL